MFVRAACMEFFLQRQHMCLEGERQRYREGERELIMEGTTRFCVRSTFVESVRAGVR